VKRLLLLDCDQFFVQCARLADPEGAGKARLLLVGGTPEGRGVVTSASYEARGYGCRSAMPTAQALRLCPEALVVPVPRETCLRKSREVRAVLERFTPLVEAASIDEAFLDLTGTERLYGGEDPGETARRIQVAVVEETRIIVSIGGGSSRIVAKLAAERAKPGGVFVVPPGAEETFMAEHELGQIPGVGPVLRERLRGMGLTSVRDALALDLPTLQAMLGEGRGSWLHHRIRGRGPDRVDPRSGAKSISREETFPTDLHRDGELEDELVRLGAEATAELRRSGLTARTVTVKVRDGDFRTRSASRTLAEPVESERAIVTVAVELLERLRARRRVGVRLLGVGLSGLSGEGGEGQLGLFEDGAGEESQGPLETERDRAVSRLSDELRERFGPTALRSGRLL